VVTGWSLTLREASEWAAKSIAAATWPAAAPSVTIAIYVTLLSLLNGCGGLPLAWYGGHVVERRYGLSIESTGRWAVDEAKSLGVGVVLGGCGAMLTYSLIRLSPHWWWLSAGVLFTLIVIGLTKLAPILLLPLFHTVRPIDREALRVRLLALAERAGARVLGAYEWGLSVKTRKANAALAGIGGTRRILVSDTMLAEYSDEEIEVILAHELAHHKHGDIWKGIALESAVTLAGFYLAAHTLARYGDRVGLRDAADPAGLPLLLLAAGAVSLVMTPIAHAVSRVYERSADRFALNLTRNPSAFISAMQRLGAQNLAEERPSKAVQWLFYSHPPISERIAAARAFSTQCPAR
jgi:STE24 endopeptidase